MAKHGESPGRSSETVRVAEQGSLPAIHLSREETIQRAVYAALGCTSIDWRSALRVDQAAAQIARFVEDALLDFDDPLRTALAQIADGDAYHDGASKFMAIARAALNIQQRAAAEEGKS